MLEIKFVSHVSIIGNEQSKLQRRKYMYQYGTLLTPLISSYTYDQFVCTTELQDISDKIIYLLSSMLISVYECISIGQYKSCKLHYLYAIY